MILFLQFSRVKRLFQRHIAKITISTRACSSSSKTRKAGAADGGARGHRRSVRRRERSGFSRHGERILFGVTGGLVRAV